MTGDQEVESEELIERVARAIYEARWGGGNWDVLAEQRSADFEISKWRPMAIAAIKEIQRGLF